jgi:hypothetical protein
MVAPSGGTKSTLRERESKRGNKTHTELHEKVRASVERDIGQAEEGREGGKEGGNEGVSVDREPAKENQGVFIYLFIHSFIYFSGRVIMLVRFLPVCMCAVPRSPSQNTKREREVQGTERMGRKREGEKKREREDKTFLCVGRSPFQISKAGKKKRER